MILTELAIRNEQKETYIYLFIYLFIWAREKQIELTDVLKDNSGI